MGAWVSSVASGKELAFLAEQRSAEMFVTVSIYKAKAGEEDAVIALHEAQSASQDARLSFRRITQKYPGSPRVRCDYALREPGVCPGASKRP